MGAVGVNAQDEAVFPFVVDGIGVKDAGTVGV